MSRVLVVDDEPAVGESLGDVLEAEGHAARWVANSAAALAAIAEETFDLALVDVRLGAESGSSSSRS